MIDVENLHKSYAGRSVVSGVTAHFPRGSMTSLIGPNGAGKSTLLMMMARLLPPTSGSVSLNGDPVAGIPVEEYVKQVATLRQAPDFNLRLTVEELVGFGRFPHSRGALTLADHAAIDRALEVTSLGPLRKAYIDELSGGQRQTAFLAMTIAQDTDYLLLDEPLNNLDMRHAVEIMQTLRALCVEFGRTVVVVIHDINFAANYSDRILALKAGKVHAAGPVADVVTEDRLRALYDINLEILPTASGRVCNYFNMSEGV
ncbi:ATP-binding cassette domain-containing protein [Nisaea sp.]|uniref:iron ABC transporter ATP-binding protein n=2 Tax=Alphaproteobacteria TaxID=28211 RepID=UPI003267F822